MKIGIVCHPTMGGSGIVATELGMALANKGHEVHFISYKQPARLKLVQRQIFFHQVEVDHYPLFKYPPYELALISKIVQVYRQFNLDLIHAHYAIPHAMACFTAKQILADQGYTMPVVTTLHGTDITLVGKNNDYKCAVTFSINHSDKVTSVSSSLKQQTIDTFGSNPDHIQVIHNFIDHSKFKSGELKRSSLADDHERIICHVSNLRHVKQPIKVLEVFNKIHQQLPSKLFVVGSGPELQKMEEYVKEHQLEEAVRFYGETHQIYEILEHSDLFLLPSLQESFGLSALEAMAAHTAVIASNIGGLNEVVQHGKSGFLCDPSDVDCMAAKALSILSDKTVLEEYKQNAHANSHDFSIHKILPQYEQVYNDLLEVNRNK